MKNKNTALLIVAIALILVTYTNGISAYFTTYTEAMGGYIVHVGDDTDIYEQFSNWTKRVTVVSGADAQPLYVRARAFAGDEYTLLYSGTDWTLGEDGYFYYSKILYPGEETKELLIRIEDIPEDAVPGDSFNVEVIYETSPVLYDENGNPYADWSVTLGGNRE